MTCVHSCFSKFACILCYKVPYKKNDINFLNDDVKSELEAVPVALPFALYKCICKSCLSVVRKRKGVREKLRELDRDIRVMAMRQATLSESVTRPTVAKKLEYRATSSM